MKKTVYKQDCSNNVIQSHAYESCFPSTSVSIYYNYYAYTRLLNYKQKKTHTHDRIFKVIP